MNLDRATRSAIAVLTGAVVAALTLPAYLAGYVALAPVSALLGVLLVAWGIWQLERHSPAGHVGSNSSGRGESGR